MLHVSASQNRVLCREADVGAVEFLLPSAAVRAFVAEHFPEGVRGGLLPHEIGRLKEHFDVSWDTAIIRLEELGYQDRRVSKGLIEWNNGSWRRRWHPLWLLERVLRVHASRGLIAEQFFREIMEDRQWQRELQGGRRAG